MIIGEGDSLFHIPGASDQYETVCGWVNMEYEYFDAEEQPVTCESCLRIVRYCRNLRLPNGSLP